MEVALVQRLLTLMSTKGEDIMLQVGGDARLQQRFRNTIPASLGVWKEICGWKWPQSTIFHINRLELRALYAKR